MVHLLRKKPVGLLEAEDLRLLLLQREGVDVLVPIALAWLARDPLLEGDFYPGDLLAAVLHIPPCYWQAHPDHLATVERIIATVRTREDADDDLGERIEAFHRRLRDP